MPFPLPFIRPHAAEERPAFVRTVSRGDAQWNRRVFRAPPLEVTPPVVAITPKPADGKRPAASARV
ncbi:MAG: hypothetical protein RL324_2305 [Verrucomicrobiota bacterium]|jgi:hypothetical protein